tara:strand:+ start:202 stop:522 length:321 start_codon:yes stop_codon:yes gene_type:complete
MAYADKQYLPLGTKGSAVFTTGNAAVYYEGIVYVAITFLEASEFEVGVTGLVPETNYLFPSSNATSSAIAANSVATDGITFPAGLTIYGRWTGFELASGSCIAYVG